MPDPSRQQKAALVERVVARLTVSRGADAGRTASGKAATGKAATGKTGARNAGAAAGEASALERFVRRTYEGVAADLLLEFTPDALYGAALSLWRFAQRREPGRPKIRVYNPTREEHGWQTTHTVVEIVNDDMPFIVDSVVAALNRAELIVHLLVHPILRVARDGEGRIEDVLAPGEAGGTDESVLHVQVSQRTAPQALEAIRAAIAGVLDEVRAAVEDWRLMRARLDDIIAECARAALPVPADEAQEGRAFLEWMRDDNFTFLGVRDYAIVRRGGKDYLDIVAGSGLGVLRAVGAESVTRHRQPLSAETARVARQKSLLIITKANSRSRVHRPVHMDYIGVRRFDAAGAVVGERRFVGLFTSSAYNRNPMDIPLLRRKIRQVIERTGFNPGGHSAKAILNILETYPRDELFQIGTAELFETATGILHLEERQRVRLFVRKDDYARFCSCLVYVPRERYTTDLRHRLEAVLRAAFRSESIDFNAHVSDAPMARVHFIVRTPGDEAADLDVAAVEARLSAATRSWSDDLHDALVEDLGEARGHELFQRSRLAFPAGYQEAFAAHDAGGDIERVLAVLGGAPIAMNLYRHVDGPEGEVRFKLFHAGAPVPLSDILPVLEHMGLKVVAEIPFAVRLEGEATAVYIHDFELRLDGPEPDVGAMRERFHETFARVWAGHADSDALNRLVVEAGLDWRQVVVLRAYTRYLGQARAPFSQGYIEDTLAKHGTIARALVRLFEARFDPDARDAAAAAAIEVEIGRALDSVSSLDEDGILRRMLNLVQATLRTNHYQPAPDGGPKGYLSLKLDSAKVDGLPAPKPMAEIFVYSPRTEGIHLRGGKVARGGIRWSDRREDYRTEILGLMKAQTVKNAVIVPVGSKGGFVVKRPPAAGGREALQAEVVECYRTLMRGLLDLTDNLKGVEVVPPARVVRHDGDDPYLVVAADKGTATFSDIANAEARAYGFWLDDAFASGGSAGYDHKKMGITARGAWVSVERHFRELGHDTRTTPFTAVGVGDMAGDVFGNGVLQSDRIRLLGAFNHMHLFLDPNPDPAKSFAERKRLFDLPRSSWADYDAALVSKGGGVHARDLKAVKLSAEVRAMLGIAAGTATPAEIVRALLCMKVDLLWFGGIGTFVKASDESHADAGDRVNDAVRVDGGEIGARVVGEGANLGFTQRGRVEYALAGGRINTDAIDNSGGVDCSDHEVNIKILLGEVVEAGDMTLAQRDLLLERMTDELADLVLKDNYQQTQAISVMAARAPELLEQQARLMRALERARRLDRALEFLPDDEALALRRASGLGLTRPEIAVVLAYAKIALYDDLLASDLPDDPLLAEDLVRYFPKPLGDAHRPALLRHRLRREIIANVVTNSMINRVGASFLGDVEEKTGHKAHAIARAYAIARDAFDMRAIWRAIEALDGKIPAALQTGMMLEAGRLVERAVFWFLANGAHPLDVAALAAEFRPGIATLSRALSGLLSPEREARFVARAEDLIGQGVTADLARRVASLEDLAASCDIVRLAHKREVSVERVGAVYFALGARLGFDWLREAAGRIKTETAWQRVAIEAIVDDLFAQQSDLAATVLDAGGEAPSGALESWLAARAVAVGRADALLSEYRAGPGVDLAMLAVANRQLRALG